MAKVHGSYVMEAGENEIFAQDSEKKLVGQSVDGWTVIEATRLSHKQILIRLEGEVEGVEHLWN